MTSGAKGYRLPTEAEWEWSARGGLYSQDYVYSGSNDVNEVAWYWSNSSDGTKAVGTKARNELGIYDMSGNVCEWCQDVVLGDVRNLRGGGWNDGAFAVGFRELMITPWGRWVTIGFRVARNAD